MPVFTIKAKDRLAIHAIEAYQRLCQNLGLEGQAAEVAKAIREMVLWRRRNPELVQMPDHRHVPAGQATADWPTSADVATIRERLRRWRSGEGLPENDVTVARFSADAEILLAEVDRLTAPPLTDDERATIIEVLCSQALADHLGDVRDAEVKLWGLLGVERRAIVRDHDTAWRNTKATLAAAGLPLPSYHSGEDDA